MSSSGRGLVANGLCYNDTAIMKGIAYCSYCSNAVFIAGMGFYQSHRTMSNKMSTMIEQNGTIESIPVIYNVDYGFSDGNKTHGSRK